MLEERIHYLLRAYTEHVATAEEEEELFQWVTVNPDNTILKDYIKRLIQTRADMKFPEVDWENLYREVLQRAKKEASDSPVRHIRWYRIVAAVLALTMAGSCIYLFWHKAQQSSVNEIANTGQPHSNDIEPGSSKAILQAGNVQVTLNKKDTVFTLAGNAVHINGGNVEIADVQPTQYTLITPRGGTYKLALADGTVVWLNAASKLVYPSVFTGSTRVVKLEGEAYFEVHTDANHPFIVKTDRQEVEVLGTEFNIHAYADEANIVTTLVKGKVQVNSRGGKLELQPGQQAQLNASGQLGLNPGADVAQAIAWKNGYFRFDKADIHTIMQQLARWYDADVHYDAGLQSSHYFGAIISRDNNISQILNMLEATGEIHFRIEGKEVTVMP